MAAEAFPGTGFYATEETEGLITALLTLISLTAFGYVCKTPVLASGKEKLNVGSFALGVAVDQAQNPLNFISWVRGTPDLPTDENISTTELSMTKKIPSRRAVSAIFVTAAVFIAEVFIFYAVMPKSRELTLGQMTLGVNQTEEPTRRSLKPNTCVPQMVEMGRAQLSGVFAFCNVQTELNFDIGVPITAAFNRSAYSLRVFLTDGNRTSQSITSFSLLLPEEENTKKTNLVVRLQGNTGTAASDAIREYYNRKGCDASGNTIAMQRLTGCTQQVEASEILEILITYVQVVYDVKAGDVGDPNGESIIVAPQNLVIGSTPGQRFSYLFMIILTPILLVAAFIVYRFISDDGTAILAALIREKTGQGRAWSAIAMEEGTITIADVYRSPTSTPRESN